MYLMKILKKYQMQLIDEGQYLEGDKKHGFD